MRVSYSAQIAAAVLFWLAPAAEPASAAEAGALEQTADQAKAAASAEASEKSAATTSPAATAESAAEARAALERTVARYRGLKSYQDRFHCAARLKLKGGEGPEIGHLEGALMFAAPDRLVSKTDALHLYHDGQQLTRYLPHQRQYAVTTGPDVLKALAPENWFSMGEEGLAVHPLVALLALRDLPGEQALVISELSSVAPETRAGQAGLLLKGRLQITGMPVLPALGFSAFISGETQLFREISIDMSEMFRAFAAEDEAEDAEIAEVLITFEDVVIDAALPDETFAFEPAGARKVTQLGYYPEPVTSPLDLLGQTAPDLSGSTLSGEDFDLAAQRGRVVLVAFWGTWSPGVGEFIDELQELIRAHADGPLTVVGVLRNGAAGETAVRRIMAERKASFPQVLDREATGISAWHVAGLPAVFLIDQQGVIAEAYPTWDKEACRRQIAALLKSEPLYSPEARQERRAAAADVPGGVVFKVPTSQPAGERLQAGESQSVMAHRWNMSEQDIDEDGEIELILPGWTGQLSVVKPSTGEVQNVTLRGLGRSSISGARALKIDGETCWLVTSQQGSYPAERVDVRLYAPGGEVIWTFTPDVPEKSNTSAIASAGDLDGDGAVEYAIGLTTYTPVSMGENSWTWSDSTSRLLILDNQGRLIGQEELAQQLDLLYIGSGKPGRPATLLCLSGGELQRFTLAPRSE